MEKQSNNSFFSLTPDDNVQKRIIQEADANSKSPEEGKLVIIQYEGDVDSNKFAFHSNKESGIRRFTLGQDKVIPGLEICVKSMKIGEKSEFEISGEHAYFDSASSTDLNRKIKFTLLLHDTNEFIRKENAKAFQLKLEAIELFNSQKFEEAIAKFEEAFQIVNKSPHKYTPDLKDLRFKLLLNISNCYLHIENFDKCVIKVDEAMKIMENPKCYYIRAYANAARYNIKSAENDLLFLQSKMSENDPMLQQLKNLIDKNKKSII